MGQEWLSSGATDKIKSEKYLKELVTNTYRDQSPTFILLPQITKNPRREYLFTVIKIRGGIECFVAIQGLVLGVPSTYDNYEGQFDAHTEFLICEQGMNQKKGQDIFDSLEFSKHRFKR